MFGNEFAEPRRVVEVRPLGLENMNGFDVLFDAAVDGVKLAFELLNHVGHDQIAET